LALRYGPIRLLEVLLDRRDDVPDVVLGHERVCAPIEAAIHDAVGTGQLAIDAMPIVDMARDRGLLVNRTNEKVLRMLPPLTIEAADLDRAVDILDGVFAAVEAEVHA